MSRGAYQGRGVENSTRIVRFGYCSALFSASSSCHLQFLPIPLAPATGYCLSRPQTPTFLRGPNATSFVHTDTNSSCEHPTASLLLSPSSSLGFRGYVAADGAKLCRSEAAVSSAPEMLGRGRSSVTITGHTSLIASRPPRSHCRSSSLVRVNFSMALSTLSAHFAFAEVESTSHALGTKPSD